MANPQAKYIVFDNDSLPTMVIFPNHLVHKDMARYLGRLGDPLSAGFIEIYANGESLICAKSSGGSESLKLEACEARDTYLANCLLDTGIT